MKQAIDAFDGSIQRVRALGGLYSAIRALTTPIVDGTDILRSQIVLAVSALDYLVHEMTVHGVLEVFDGARPLTNAYKKLCVPLGAITISAQSVLERDALEAFVREKHGYLTFQRPDKIADAIRLFSSVELWDAVGVTVGERAARVKDRLNLIVDRRNKIAHESDLDPSYPGVRWPVSEQDVDNVIATVSRVGHAIFDACAKA